MSLDLEDDAAVGTLSADEVGDGRKGYERVDGVWVEKDADEPSEPDRDGFEEIDGVWVEKAMGNAAVEVEADILSTIRNFVRPRKLGRVLGSNGAYRLFGEQSTRTRKPDVSFVAAGRVSADDAKKAEWALAPDLAVEVISPTEMADDAETKLDEYLRAGVRLVWVVYLPTRNVWAYRPDGTARRYRADDTLPGEDVLPGFAVRVAELFEGL